MEECFEVGDVSVGYKTCELSLNSGYRWVRKYKATDSARFLLRKTEDKMSEMAVEICS